LRCVMLTSLGERPAKPRSAVRREAADIRAYRWGIDTILRAVAEITPLPDGAAGARVTSGLSRAHARDRCGLRAA
jgi:hypothetical protein